MSFSTQQRVSGDHRLRVGGGQPRARRWRRRATSARCRPAIDRRPSRGRRRAVHRAGTPATSAPDSPASRSSVVNGAIGAVGRAAHEPAGAAGREHQVAGLVPGRRRGRPAASARSLTVPDSRSIACKRPLATGTRRARRRATRTARRRHRWTAARASRRSTDPGATARRDPRLRAGKDEPTAIRGQRESKGVVGSRAHLDRVGASTRRAAAEAGAAAAGGVAPGGDRRSGTSAASSAASKGYTVGLTSTGGCFACVIVFSPWP